MLEYHSLLVPVELNLILQQYIDILELEKKLNLLSDEK